MNVLCIHGFSGSSNEHKAIRKALQKHNIHTFSFDYKEKFGTIQLEELAYRCNQAITEHNIDAIIGISQGGVIAAAAVELFNTTKQLDIITICAPWSGSKIAYLLPFVGVKELRPNSRLLQKIKNKVEKSKHKYYAIYNPLDLMVYPGTSAINQFAKENLKVYSILHPTTFFDKNTIAFCTKILTEEIK